MANDSKIFNTGLKVSELPIVGDAIKTLAGIKQAIVAIASSDHINTAGCPNYAANRSLLSLVRVKTPLQYKQGTF